MEVFSLPQIAAGLAPAEIYREILRVPALSLGLYRHLPGQSVPQNPHGEDEIYHVVSGRGEIEIAGKSHVVGPGSVVYIPARVPHHFHSVTETLDVLVVFAPAEGSASGAL